MTLSSRPVSVVVPVRNGADFIAQALESILAQTAVPAEVIVVDDGSTDSTADIVQTFPSVEFVRQPPLGVSAARNLGAARATQPFLCFLDADDLWVPTKTELQLASFDDNSETDIVIGMTQNFRLTPQGENIFLGAASAAYVPGVMMMRTSAFHLTGPFSTELAYGENLEWWARALDHQLKTRTLPQCLLLRRIHNNNSSRDSENATRRYIGALHAITRRRRESAAESPNTIPPRK
jgi:glycosyltransferase involved in cell wall biosynthesis